VSASASCLCNEMDTSSPKSLTSVYGAHIISLVGPLAHIFYTRITQKIGEIPTFAKGEAVHMNYLHASADALGALFTLSSFIGLAIGIAWGLLVSFMPGVGGNVAIALLLPFIFRLPVPQALALLLGTHIATYFGGSITSITMNIPASSKSVSLCWDGYPLARKGKGAYALGASATASSIGGVVGAIVLTIGIPIMKKLLDVISSPEIFVLAIWGVVIIAVFSSGDLTKGVMAGGLGVLLSWVGQSPITGLDRLTFGSSYLSEGIQFATAAMGLFAVAQAIRMLAETRQARNQPAGHTAGSGSVTEVIEQMSTTWSGARAVLSRWRLTLYMSFFGVFTGTIPGLGAPVAAIAAYGQAAQMSKNKDEFGHGAIEGVIAPQATDAAAEGGGMLPMLALGIPTHEQQAILLSAFIVLGIAPGPTMLTDHLNVVFQVIWIIVLASLIVGAIGLLTGRQLAKLSALPANMLVPLILVIAIVGSYAVNGRIGDSVMTVIFGLVGYVCFKYNYSRVNLIIGLALGPILESNLHISTELYGSAFLIHRPVAAGLTGVVIATVVWWIWSQRSAKRKSSAAMSNASTHGAAAMGVPGVDAIVTAVGFVLVFAIAGIVGLGYGALTGRILVILALFCLVLAMANVVKVARAHIEGTRNQRPPEAEEQLVSSSSVEMGAHITVLGSTAQPDGSGSTTSNLLRSNDSGDELLAVDPDMIEEAQRELASRSSGGSLIDLALERRASREGSAAKIRGYEMSSAGAVVAFLAVVLLAGLVPGAGLAMTIYRVLSARVRTPRTFIMAVVSGLVVSLVTWVLFATLVNQFIPYGGLLFGSL
jgi:putative tricarboxylic transport membrane protein